MSVMHKLVMRRINAIFNGALVVGLKTIVLQSAAPTFLTPLFDINNRWALRFGKIAKKRENQAVTFFNGISICAGAAGNVCILTQRRQPLHITGGIKLPAMIRALDTITFDFAVGKRTAAVSTGITQASSLACFISENH